MSEARKARRTLRKQKAQFIRSDADGKAMLSYAAAWIGTLPGFERSSRALRERIVIDLRSRDRVEFAPFGDRDVGGGIYLVDPITGRPISLAVIYAAKVRALLTGGTGG